MHADCFRRRELEAISVGPDREFIETTLNMSLDDVDIFRPTAHHYRDVILKITNHGSHAVVVVD